MCHTPLVQAVPGAQREKLFNTYMTAVQQLQAQAQERASRARAGFQVRLYENRSVLGHELFKFATSGARRSAPPATAPASRCASQN